MAARADGAHPGSADGTNRSRVKGEAVGKLLSISVRDASRAPMQILEQARVTRERGVEGDRRGRVRGRQVTVLAREGWEAACADLGAALDWTTRRANLLVEGVDLAESVGARLCIGQVVLEVTEETEPCQRMEEAHAGLRGALVPDWRGGVSCNVVEGGAIRCGDGVRLESAGA